MDTVIVARPAFRQQFLMFARHYAEMCVSMCAAGVPLTLVVLAGASTFAGYDVRERFPELGLLLVALTLTLPMTAWMLFRHMALRPTLEMAAAAFAIALALIAGVTGRPHRTPLLMFRRGEEYVVALWYGPDVQWVRNVVAAGGGQLRVGGDEVRVVEPEVFEDRSLAPLPAPLRVAGRLVGLSQFIRMRAAS